MTGLNFLTGDGEVAELMRNKDWRGTLLGPPEDWPSSLKVAIKLMLSTRHPMIIFWGKESDCLYNDAYVQFIGPERHPQALGQSAKAVWAEIWPIMSSQIDQVMSGGPATWNENQLIPITRNGHYKDAYWTYSYSPIEDGTTPSGVGGVMVICNETTQFVLNEQRAVEEKDRLFQLFQQAPSFMAYLNGSEHRISNANLAFFELIGGRKALGKTIAEVLPDAVAQGYLELLNSVYQTSETYKGIQSKYERQIEAYGPVTTLFVDFVFQPILNDQNEITGIFIIGTDVTQHVKVQEALKQSRHQLELMTNAIPQQVWTANPNGGVEYINDHTKTYVGEVAYSDGLIDWMSVVHEEDRPGSLEQWTLSLKTGQSFEIEQRIYHYKSKAYRWNLSRALPIKNDEGEITRWFGTNTDIHDHKIAQQNMEKALLDADLANQAKSEFLANMSHEIRTPMNVVIGLTRLLSKSYPLTRKQTEFIDTLQMSAESLLALINDLLDIARIESGSIEPELVNFDLSELIIDVTVMNTVGLEGKGLSLELDLSVIKHMTFCGDAQRIKQVIINLYNNALKFTHEGKITIRAYLIKGHFPLVIEVEDTGIGIARETMDTIFDKFVQADSTINRKYGGSGLGLSISKNLVEMMGGVLSVHSKLGEGSVFRLKLPLQPIHGQKSKTAPLNKGVDIPLAFYKAPVLLVEDHAPNVLVARSYLEEFGFVVDVATHGQAAFDKVKGGSYVLVFMDVQMQGLNGLEATRRIRSHESERGLKAIPIIGMTAHALIGYREQCLEAGMNEYISKPFNPDELLVKINRLLERVQV
jgi:signal transduction histidine kinase/CheY-like chemotaxis protein